MAGDALLHTGLAVEFWEHRSRDPPAPWMAPYLAAWRTRADYAAEIMRGSVLTERPSRRRYGRAPFESPAVSFVSSYCQISVMGVAVAALPAWEVPFMSSMVRRTLKWLYLVEYAPCLTCAP